MPNLQPTATISFDVDTHEWVASVDVNGVHELARVKAAPGQEAADLVEEMTRLGRKLGQEMARLFL